MAKPVCSIIIVAIGLGRSTDYACPEKLRGKRCRQTSWSGRGRVPETNLGHPRRHPATVCANALTAASKDAFDFLVSHGPPSLDPHRWPR